MHHFEGREFTEIMRYQSTLQEIIKKNDHRFSEANDLYNLMMKLKNYVAYLKTLDSLSCSTRSFLMAYTIDYINRLKPLVELMDKK